jgi:hypothetical protein
VPPLASAAHAKEKRRARRARRFLVEAAVS